MSREGLETPLLGLLRKLDPEEVPLDDLVDEDTAREIDRRSASSLLGEVLEHGDPHDRIERYWMARLLVELDRRGGDDVQELLDPLAAKLLLPFEERGEGSTSVRSLRAALRLLQPGEPISQDALGLLSDAFRGVVEVLGEASQERVLFSGSGAELATLLIELATGGSLHCNMSIHREVVGGTPGEVIKVEVDTCTNRSFDDCKGSSIPRGGRPEPVLQKRHGAQHRRHVGAELGGGHQGGRRAGDQRQGLRDGPGRHLRGAAGVAVTDFDLAPLRTDPGRSPWTEGSWPAPTRGSTAGSARSRCTGSRASRCQLVDLSAVGVAVRARRWWSGS